MSNVFAPSEEEVVQINKVPEPKGRRVSLPNYSASPCSLLDHIIAFLMGFAVGFAVLFVFYQLIAVSIVAMICWVSLIISSARLDLPSIVA